MALSTRAGARRASSLAAAFGVVLAMLFVASPAQAAPVVNLSASDTTIALGESVTLSWSASQDTTELTASGDWDGAKDLPNGAEAITPTEAGTYTYTLVAGNDTDPDSTDSVTVTVEPGPITPNPVTFPDACTVVIPTTPNVTYFVDFGDGDTQELDAETYDGADLSEGDEVTFYAEANDGFTLADDAVTEWDYTAPDECFGEMATLVKADATCGKVTFESVSDVTVTVLYGSEGEDEADGEVTLGAGKSRTISTHRDELLFIAFTEDDEDVQFDTIEVPQDCENGNGNGNGNGSKHPTVAPAAGLAR